MKLVHRKFRELLIAAVETLDPDGIAPIQLSGGVDSATLLAAQLARGVKPPCYTWRLEGFESDDLKVARMMAKAHDLHHRIVPIPAGRDALVADVRRIWDAVDRREDLFLKTVFQCTHPYLYLAPALAEDGHKASFWGHAAGNYFADSKNEMCEYSRSGELWWRKFREEALEPAFYKKGGTTESADLAAKIHGHEHLYPYLDMELTGFVVTLLMPQVNKPFHKALAVMAFPEFWDGRPWRRKNAPYQICGGIKRFHETLLQSPFNKAGARDLLPVYREIVAPAP